MQKLSRDQAQFVLEALKERLGYEEYYVPAEALSNLLKARNFSLAAKLEEVWNEAVDKGKMPE